MKKVWQKPKLVVLYRGKPEESVLIACKGRSLAGPAKNHCRALKGNFPCNVQAVT